MVLCCVLFMSSTPKPLGTGQSFWFRPNLVRPLALVTKCAAGVETRLLFASQAFYSRHRRVWKGCGVTPIALCVP